MRTVFLDSVGLVGLWDIRDPWHEAAAAAFGELTHLPFNAVTTPLVLIECASIGARRTFRPMVSKLRDELVANRLLIEPLPEEIDAAWEDYRSKRFGTASLVDIVSFHVMRRDSISEVFSNDRHFASAGFTLLL